MQKLLKQYELELSTSELEKFEKFLEIFKNKACNITYACDAIPIDRQTYYNWMEKDPKFKAKIMAHQESLLDFSESMLMKNIHSGKEASVFFHLKTKGKARGYIERQEIEHQGQLDQKMEIEIVHTDPVKDKKKKK